MAYNHITNRNAKQFTKGRGSYGFQHLYIIHHWGDPNTNPTAEGVVNYFATTAPTSAHLVLTGTGRKVYQMVNDADTAYHAGDWAVNCKSIGIECDPRARDEDYDVLAEVLADYWIYHGVEPTLMGHREIVPTACPGRYDINRIDRLMHQKYNEKRNPTPPPATTPKPKPEWKNMDEPRVMIAKENLYVINLDTMKNQGDAIMKGTKIEFSTKADFNGVLYLRSKYATDKGLNWGIDIDKLNDIEEPKNDPQPEMPKEEAKPPKEEEKPKDPEPQPEPEKPAPETPEEEKPTPTPIEPETPSEEQETANNKEKEDTMILTPEQKEEILKDHQEQIININEIKPLGTTTMLILVSIADLLLAVSASLLAYDASNSLPIALGVFAGSLLTALGYYRKGKKIEVSEE